MVLCSAVYELPRGSELGADNDTLSRDSLPVLSDQVIGLMGILAAQIVERNIRHGRPRRRIVITDIQDASRRTELHEAVRRARAADSGTDDENVTAERICEQSGAVRSSSCTNATPHAQWNGSEADESEDGNRCERTSADRAELISGSNLRLQGCQVFNFLLRRPYQVDDLRYHRA
jgi:hypothetical protein